MSHDSQDEADRLDPDFSTATPTSGRWIVLGLLCLLSGILYMDRICFSQAVTPMSRELGLSKQQIALVMMAFTLAYGLFEIPVGRWGDRSGTRGVLARIAVTWSLFTALTGACTGLLTLIVVRFLFGAGEAGAYPNSARVLARWFPDTERGRAQGLLLASAQVGSMAAMPIAAYLIEYAGWRWMFATFGLLGVIWATVFYWWFRDDPAEHFAVNAAERQIIGGGRAAPATRHDPIPWRLVRSNFSVWLLGAIMTCAAFNSYFYYSWFPTYLKEARGVTNIASGWLTALPYVGTGLGMLLGGGIAEWIARRCENRDRATRAVGGTVYLLAAGCLWLAVRRDEPAELVALAAASCLCMSTTLPLWWSCAIRISGRHVGALFGLMNMVGGVGAMSSQYFIGWFTDRSKGLGYEGRAQWDPAFTVYVTMLAVGAVCWALYRSQLVEADEDHASS
jgi:sugar phosphate permease